MLKQYQIRFLICSIIIIQGIFAYAGKGDENGKAKVIEEKKANETEKIELVAEVVQGKICFKVVSTGEIVSCTRSGWAVNLGGSDNFISAQLKDKDRFKNDGSTPEKAIELTGSPKTIKEVILPLFEYGEVAVRPDKAHNAILVLDPMHIEVSEDRKTIPGFVVLRLGKEDVKVSQQQCPENYVLVPGNPIYNTPTPNKDFCVMKYTASNDGRGRAVSAQAMPWVGVDRDQAEAGCQRNGENFHVISNDMWQVIARDIENTAANWSGGAVGNGFLPRGNSNSQSAFVPGNDEAEINNPDKTHKRIFILSNGGKIWDMAGNVYQWVLGNLPTVRRQDRQEYSNLNHFADGSDNRRNFAPLHIAFNSSQNVGKIFMGDTEAVLRGGRWDDGSGAGVFAANLVNAASTRSPDVGFRCGVSVP